LFVTGGEQQKLSLAIQVDSSKQPQFSPEVARSNSVVLMNGNRSLDVSFDILKFLLAPA
jgi:hypothetical protein